jgi:putative ABC transport system permease protein
MVTLLGVALGVAAVAAAVVALAPWLQSSYGVTLTLSAPSPAQWGLLAAVLAAGFVASLVPGWRAYRLSLADGLSPRS